ncbi:MAG TPA: SGNH/GDSL hydrolase family protein [Actinophytocola sp.]|uniref:SGNH/GDSL hydrolase family protein n=1 Tax=Actinophytocola sp. TaxID=1872138 RepID=UPI002DBFAF81|nr:SGNH/GDSL hydrolase family protein [Actinophytocola sp.]HEU5474141.1 SGNH/GDSL hydrolase family protein [Actinophytocola sp.]
MTQPGGSGETVRVLTVLGDSVAVGVGDPALSGGWRGFAPMLARALGAVELVNVSVNGARVSGVRAQVDAALRARPDVGVLVVGMNDTMRSDFDPIRMGADLDAVLGPLVAAGTVVIMVRYHDHHRVFRLPGPLCRALAGRIAALNAVLDSAARRNRVAVLDLGAVPEVYQTRAWAVDRLHPSEFGHRMLARALAARLADLGVPVRAQVSLVCGGGRPHGSAARWGWLVCKGLPWLVRRGRDLVPYLGAALLRDLAGRESAPPIGGVQVEHR